MKTALILPAGGSGRRMAEQKGKQSVPKQLIELSGRAVILRTLDVFVSHSKIDLIIISAKESICRDLEMMIENENYQKLLNKKIIVIKGGKSRQESVWNGLFHSELDAYDNVLVHDVVRPFVSHELISDVINSLKNNDAVIPVVELSDTIKICKNDFVEKTLERKNLRAVQTPQGFRRDALVRANIFAKENNLSVTDDASVCEAFGIKVKTIKGDPENIKITTSLDLLLAELIIKSE
jgi:2-C-methyl-D-erythritol 4-phosphate cytidylyltransferase